MAETRCYLVIDAAATRTPAQWQILISGLKLKPMIAALIERARASISNTVNIHRYSLDTRYMLGGFEMAEEERDYLLAVLEAERIAQGVADGLAVRETFRQVMLEEIRDVAVEAGFPALAPLLDMTIEGWGARMTAIADANAWLDLNQANWEMEL